MNSSISAEILINCTRVSNDLKIEIYELVLNEQLKVIECVKVESLAEGIVYAIDDYLTSLSEVLFELNHVRVNPLIDNAVVIDNLTQALDKIGVAVTHPPQPHSMAMCYKPLGEITENVRFYFNSGRKMTFMAPKAKLRLITNHNLASISNKHYP